VTEFVERPCPRCGEPTYNEPPRVCRECHIEGYHERLDAMVCPSCKRIRYADEVGELDLIVEIRRYLWGGPCACKDAGMSYSASTKGTDKASVIATIDGQLAASEKNYRDAGSAEADQVAYARKLFADTVSGLTPTADYPVIVVNVYGSFSPGYNVTQHIDVSLGKLEA
jgi:hypothetical protein